MASNDSIWKKGDMKKISIRLFASSFSVIFAAGDHKIYDARTLFIINTYVPTKIDN